MTRIVTLLTWAALVQIMQPLVVALTSYLSYSPNLVQMGQTVDFVCTVNGGGSFTSTSSSSSAVSAWLYVLVSGSQTQVAYGLATSFNQTFPCGTMASLSGRIVQCTFSADQIVFSLSNVLVSDGNVYGCQVFVGANVVYSISWASYLSVYALPKQSVMSFNPGNPLITGQYLYSVTCTANVGFPTGSISLYYQAANVSGTRQYFTASPNIGYTNNSDGTINATYTFNLPQTTCQYVYVWYSGYQYVCTNSFGGSIASSNNGDVYSCEASNSYSNGYYVTTSQTLNVLYSATSPTVSVFINSQNYYFNSIISVRVSDCIYLTCSASGNPAPVVAWIQVSSLANQSLALSNFRNSSNFSETAVAIGSFSYPDSLTFVCFAANSVGSGYSASIYSPAVYITVSQQSTTFSALSTSSPGPCPTGSSNGISFGGSIVNNCISSSTSTTQSTSTSPGFDAFFSSSTTSSVQTNTIVDTAASYFATSTPSVTSVVVPSSPVAVTSSVITSSTADLAVTAGGQQFSQAILAASIIISFASGAILSGIAVFLVFKLHFYKKFKSKKYMPEQEVTRSAAPAPRSAPPPVPPRQAQEDNEIYENPTYDT